MVRIRYYVGYVRKQLDYDWRKVQNDQMRALRRAGNRAPMSACSAPMAQITLVWIHRNNGGENLEIGHIPVRKRIVFFSFLRYDMVYCYGKQEKRSGKV